MSKDSMFLTGISAEMRISTRSTDFKLSGSSSVVLSCFVIDSMFSLSSQISCVDSQQLAALSSEWDKHHPISVNAVKHLRYIMS
jgi:hypothetical protein